MKISQALKDAFRVYTGHFGATVKFLITEACITLAAVTPLLFLSDSSLMMGTLLVIPFWILLVFWARVNAAAAMRDALGDGSLFSYRLIDPSEYGRKLVFGLKRMIMLLFWSIPLIACLVIAKIHYSGDMDGFTLLRVIKEFGGGDLMTGIIYMALIFIAAVLLVAFGCAFHSGDRHAFVRNNPKLVRGHHGKIVLCWICSLLTILPMIIAIAAVIVRYLPALKDLNGVVMNTVSLPSTKVSLMILAVGAVLTIPFLPLRSLIPAAFVNGLEKE